MATNTNYARLVNNSIEYAPRTFHENNAIIVPKIDDDEAYFSRGWYKVVNVVPSYDAATQTLTFNGWTIDAESNTINASYVVAPIDPDTLPKRTKKYSKLKVTMFCMQQGIWEQVKAFLTENGFYDLFVMAQYFTEDNDYMKNGVDAFCEMYKAQHPDVDVDALVAHMLNYAFDGYEEPQHS